jgi:glycosyltransferase involved in cell wall biosynthesis
MAPELSIVVPLYNEEESLRPLYGAITHAVAPLGISFEIVFVDDGSRDATVRIADEIARSDPRVCLVKFRRNYGQTPAMAAGIAQASGDVIVTMDGDLQNDPTDIGALLRKVTGVPIKDNGCSLKAYRASLIKKIPLYSEMHRFIPAMASIAGPKIAEIKVQHHARQFGSSKYGLSRIYKVLLDLMVIKTVASFTARPMLWFGMLSIPMLISAAIAFAWTIVQFASEGTLSLPIAGCGVIFLSSAIILMGSGAIGELVYKLGDMREHEFSGLTQQIRVRSLIIQ